MKISKYFMIAALSFTALAQASNTKSALNSTRTVNLNVNTLIPSPTEPPHQINPPQPGNPTPVEPPREVVKMYIQFETQTCRNDGNSSFCSIGIGGPGSDRSIVLIGSSYESIPCRGASTSPTPTPTPPPVSDEPPTKCSPPINILEGHWIDLDNSYSGKRLIGIVTIKKFQLEEDSSTNSAARSWYDIEVEVLGKNKTLAKMTGQLSSWDQLQSVKLLVEESENDYSSNQTYLVLGPPRIPNSNKTNSVNSALLEPVQWKVIGGKLIP